MAQGILWTCYISYSTNSTSVLVHSKNMSINFYMHLGGGLKPLTGYSTVISTVLQNSITLHVTTGVIPSSHENQGMMISKCKNLSTGFDKNICLQALPFVFFHKLGFVGGQKTQEELWQGRAINVIYVEILTHAQTVAVTVSDHVNLAANKGIKL